MVQQKKTSGTRHETNLESRRMGKCWYVCLPSNVI